MKLLFNYTPAEQGHLTAFQCILKEYHHTALATSKTFDYAELQNLARTQGCDAIILANQATLENVAPWRNATLSEYRGSRIKRGTDRSIHIIAPLAHIHTVAHGAFLLRSDLEKLSQTTTPTKPFTYTALKTLSACADARQVFAKAVARSCDIETASSETDTYITCISWTLLMPDGEFKSYVLPFINFGEPHWPSDGEFASAIQFMRDINALPTPTIFQNGSYDQFYLLRYHAAVANYAGDTMILHHAQYSELPKSLDFIASLHCHDYAQWKFLAEASASDKDINGYWGYNAKDTFFTLRAFLKQIDSAPSWVMRNYVELFRLVFPTLYMAFEGFHIDAEKKKTLKATAEADRAEALARLRTMAADDTFNPGSPKQVALYLYHILGAKKVRKKGKSGGTDELTLKALQLQHPILAMFIAQLFAYRKAAKAVSTYFSFKEWNGRLLYQMKLTGTETFRLASQASILWGYGTQIQNMPAYAKKMLCAGEGFTILEADYSQAEARCTAYCAEDVNLIKALEGDPDFYARINADISNGADFYCGLGTLFFGIPYAEVSPFIRNKVIKRIVHGTNYVMGVGTFIDSVEIPVLLEAANTLGIRIPGDMTLEKFASSLQEKYHQQFTRLRKNWYPSLKQEIAATGMLRSPLGHVRIFFGDPVRNHSVFRSAVAHQPQNLSVTLLNRGLWNVWKKLVVPSHGDVRLKAQIHDSIVCRVRDGREKEAGRKLRDLMTPDVTVHGRQLRIPVAVESGKCWKPTNPLDLTGEA